MADIREIIFDYAGAERQATELETLADRLSTLSDAELESILSDLDIAWKGDNAANFLAKGDSLQKKISSSATQLRNIAGTIRTISANMKKADMEAAATVTEM